MSSPIHILSVLLVLSAVALAGPKVDLVLGPAAPPLDKEAAAEVADQLQRVYQAEVKTGSAVPAKSDALILIGNPQTNPVIAALGKEWPPLTEQGHVVKSVTVGGKPALVIGGGSPAATYWAAAEHGYQLGIRVFTFGDLDPIDPPAFHVDGWNVILEPRLKLRGFTTLTSGPAGLTAWGLADQQKLLKQLAKLKYNHLVVRLEPHYPVVKWSFEGKSAKRAWLFTEKPIPLAPEAAGRTQFKGVSEFDNPDFKDKDPFEAGQALVTGLLKSAHELGMTTAVRVDPLLYPAEIASLFPPDDNNPKPLSADARRLAAAQAYLQAVVETLKDADVLQLELPRVSQLPWERGAAEAWKGLMARNQVVTPPQVVFQGPDAANPTQVNLFDFVSALVATKEKWAGKGARVLRIECHHDQPSLQSDNLVQISNNLDQILPAGTQFVLGRTLGDRTIPGSVWPPTKPAVSVVQLDLDDNQDNLLPDLRLGQLRSQLEVVEHDHWSGLILAPRSGNDLDPVVQLVAWSSFDPAITARQTLRNLVLPVCGAGVDVSVVKAFDLAERATAYNGTPASMAATASHYVNAMNEMYRANTRSRDGGRAFTLYYARRFEFAAMYLLAKEGLTKIDSLSDAEEKLTEMEKVIDNFQAAGAGLSAVGYNASHKASLAGLSTEYLKARERLEKLENE